VLDQAANSLDPVLCFENVLNVRRVLRDRVRTEFEDGRHLLDDQALAQQSHHFH
jgi:hypothetical protein